MLRLHAKLAASRAFDRRVTEFSIDEHEGVLTVARNLRRERLHQDVADRDRSFELTHAPSHRTADRTAWVSKPLADTAGFTTMRDHPSAIAT
jgi:hypothetical protein